MKIKHNIREVERGLSDFARKQLPFAVARAINDTLRDVKRNTEKRMARAIDRPTPFTLRAWALRFATKARQGGAIFAKSRQASYLRWLETGGTRHPERRAIVVPAGVRTNRYGNMARGAVPKALASDKAFSGQPRGRGGAAGIWQRVGRKGAQKLRLLVRYAARAVYRQGLGFKSGAEKTAEARLPGHFEKRLREAIKTARRPAK